MKKTNGRQVTLSRIRSSSLISADPSSSFQPLFFIQGHGEAPHPVDGDCSLLTYLQRTPEDAPFFSLSTPLIISALISLYLSLDVLDLQIALHRGVPTCRSSSWFWE
jgi:hypothetical protein